MSHDVFVSHSSNDKLVADAVCSTLEREGIRCWIAPRDIRPGDSWGSSIIKGIEDSTAMVIIFSENSNASRQVMREVERAVQKNVVIVPFRIDGVEPSADMEYFLSATHWLDAMTPEMDAHLDKLATTIKSILGRNDSEKPAPASPPTQAPASPPVQAAPTPPPAPPAPAPAPAPGPATTQGPKPPIAKTGKKNPKLLWGVIAAVVILFLAFLILKPSGSDEGGSASQVTVGDGNIKITLATKAIAADSLEIKINGNTGERDYLTIGKADSNDHSALARVEVKGNEIVNLDLPGEEGLYEVRYFDGAQRTVIARQSLKLSSPEVSLDAPYEALAGTNIDVTWKAPNNDRDYLAIAEKDAPGSKYVFYAYTAKGSPTSIRVPTKEGDYELRYISGKDKAIWARRDFRALEPKASVDAPRKAVAGETIPIEWTGPALNRDYVCVAEPSSTSGRQYQGYQYVKEGKKAELQMPDDPGSYEIRYVSGGSYIIRDSTTIEVSAVEVEIEDIGEVEAESDFTVTFDGPGNKRDYLAIFRSDDASGRYTSYKYANKGNSLQFKAPEEPGSYVMKYISGQKKYEWATKEFTVKAKEGS